MLAVLAALSGCAHRANPGMVVGVPSSTSTALSGPTIVRPPDPPPVDATPTAPSGSGLDSGAHFDAGYHHFGGPDALAYSRNRHDTLRGDFSRSENQGHLLLAALAKLRAETRTTDDLRHWLRVLLAHAEVDQPVLALEQI